jgi:hypothetical protein
VGQSAQYPTTTGKDARDVCPAFGQGQEGDAKLQFSDLIVPIAEIAWKSLMRKELAKQPP